MSADDESTSGGLDALALLSAAIEADHEGMGMIVLNAPLLPLIAALGGMLLGTLGDHHVDPREWITEQRNRITDGA